MKVLWFSSFPYPVNSNHQVHWITEWANYLTSKHGISIDIVTFSKFLDQNVKIVNDENYTIHYLKSPRGIIDIATFYKIRISTLKDYVKTIYEDYDLMHIHGLENQYQVLCEEINLPSIVSMQGIITEVVKHLNTDLKSNIHLRLKKYYEQKYLNSCKNYFCRTEWDKKFIRENVSNPKIYHNWEMIREEFETVVSDFTSNRIFFTGGTNAGKGLNLSLKILKHLQENNLDFKLVIAGNCDNNLLRKNLLDNGLDFNNNMVEIIGFLESGDLIEEMKKSFCMIHPSIVDNSPNSICEAQLAGVPVIASNVGGVPSLITHNETGFLTELNYMDFIKYINLLKNDKELWNRISRNSKKLAIVRHDRRTIAEVTLNVYNEIIQK